MDHQFGLAMGHGMGVFGMLLGAVLVGLVTVSLVNYIRS
jgi:hypothetical protein